jgi:hypothetical protein
MLVRAVFDLSTDAHPVRTERVVPEEDVLEAKAERRVSNLRSPEDLDAPFDVLPRDLRLDALDAHEILVVERAEPLDPILGLADEHFDLILFHEARSPDVSVS